MVRYCSPLLAITMIKKPLPTSFKELKRARQDISFSSAKPEGRWDQQKIPFCNCEIVILQLLKLTSWFTNNPNFFAWPQCQAVQKKAWAIVVGLIIIWSTVFGEPPLANQFNGSKAFMKFTNTIITDGDTQPPWSSTKPKRLSFLFPSNLHVGKDRLHNIRAFCSWRNRPSLGGGFGLSFPSGKNATNFL